MTKEVAHEHQEAKLLRQDKKHDFFLESENVEFKRQTTTSLLNREMLGCFSKNKQTSRKDPADNLKKAVPDVNRSYEWFSGY